MKTPEPLTHNGWQFKEKCRCGGVLKYKYMHPGKPGVLVEWWVKYAVFVVKQKSKTITARIKIGLLEQTLQTL